MKLKYVEEDVFCGVVMLVGIVLGSTVAYHFFGWVGVASVVSVYCVWRAY